MSFLTRVATRELIRSQPTLKIGAIVQARISSARLPGKVLMETAGKPLLHYLLERLRRANTLDALVVATSTEPVDDAIARFCERLGTRCRRGSLHNVAQRFREVVESEGLDAFVRIGGDSPLVDPAIVDQVVRLLLEGDTDLATNVFPRSFPAGQSVEVLTRAAFDSALKEMRADELEHVTPFFYANSDRFRIRNLRCHLDVAGVKMAVDTPEDLAVFSAVVAAMDRPHWDYGLAELVPLYRAALAAQ